MGRGLNTFASKLPGKITYGWRLLHPEPGFQAYPMPVRRSLTISVVLFLFFVGFSTPLFVMAGFTDSSFDDLASIAGFLFNAFWMLGWSVGVLTLGALFLMSVSGKETLVMGQAAEGCPVVLVRGADLAPAEAGSRALLRDPGMDLFR